MQTLVNSIIADDGDTNFDETELLWSDDEEDVKVSNMLQLINKEHNFCSSMFSGGATKADVIRMNKETKEKYAKAKQKKGACCYEMAGQGVGNVEGLTFTEFDLQ
ncbi:unnamed protein product [Arabis nemorensis]|uniref:Uncharacterized protein n=1 Tax=Arabis nemorensis TaxID=586526 RepID=A0A565BU19_9BRAS|nr:unnamed protein product [Arabis nemorensis]